MTCVVREVAWRAPACGQPAASRSPGARTPLCEAHLCRFGRSATATTPSSRRQSTPAPQQRCLNVPRRLVYSVRDSGGLLPDDSESYFCDEHHRFACRATVADGTPCPEERDRRASLSSGGVPEFCRSHARSVCRAKGKGCRSVAMDGADLCEAHRCANGIGGRGPEGHCPNQRAAAGQFCEEHVCIWRDVEGRRCSGQSVHAGACCAKHTCVRCEFGAEDGTTRCIYHLCAYGRREGAKTEYPACGEGVDKEGLCSRHRPRTRTREGGRRKKKEKQTTVVEYGRDLVEYVGEEEALEEDDTTAEYFSDPEYRPVVQVTRAAKTKRSPSTRLMKRLEYKGIEMERGGRGPYAPPPGPPPPPQQPQYQPPPPPQNPQPHQQDDWDHHHRREEVRRIQRPATSGQHLQQGLSRPSYQPELSRSRHSYQPPEETRRHPREPTRAPREQSRHRERSTVRERSQVRYQERPHSTYPPQSNYPPPPQVYAQEHYRKEVYQREQYEQQWSVEPWRPWTPRY